MNKAIVIGFTGKMKVYINVTKYEAIRRYLESEAQEELQGEDIREFDFDDEFCVYDIWEK